MTSSRWHAHGNVYLVTEEPDLTPERVREQARGTDGILQVLHADAREVEIVIWNPDGSTAEMSGNGTRIAGAWLMARTGAEDVRVRVGLRAVSVRALGDGTYESDMGDVVVGPRRLGPLLETHARFPKRTNVQVARVDGPGEVSARVWERGVGETTASGSSAVAVAAATHREGDVLVHFPGGDLRVRLRGGRAWLTGPAEPV